MMKIVEMVSMMKKMVTMMKKKMMKTRMNPKRKVKDHRPLSRSSKILSY
jgi:hypothetical protein